MPHLVSSPYQPSNPVASPVVIAAPESPPHCPTTYSPPLSRSRVRERRGEEPGEEARLEEKGVELPLIGGVPRPMLSPDVYVCVCACAFVCLYVYVCVRVECARIDETGWMQVVTATGFNEGRGLCTPIALEPLQSKTSDIRLVLHTVICFSSPQSACKEVFGFRVQAGLTSATNGAQCHLGFLAHGGRHVPVSLSLVVHHAHPQLLQHLHLSASLSVLRFRTWA
jgi:hypothetical protein